MELLDFSRAYGRDWKLNLLITLHGMQFSQTDPGFFPKMTFPHTL